MGKLRSGRAAQRQRSAGDAAQETFAEQNAAAALSAAPDEELFTVDRAGSARGARLALRARLEKQRRGGATEYSVVEERKVAQLLKEGKAQTARRTDKKRKELYDAWAAPAAAPSASAAALSETTRKRRRMAKAKAPTVVLPMGGQSMNPSFDAHQDALGQAVASEIERLEVQEEARKPITRGHLLPGTVDPEEDRDDGDESLSDSDSDEEGASRAARRTRKMRKGQYTTAERNRQRLARQRRVAAEEERQRSKKLKAINAAGDIIKSLTQQEKERRAIKEQVKMLKDAAAKEAVDPTEKSDVLLSEEVSSSLRGMRTRGSQVQERAAIIAAQGHHVHRAAKQKRVHKRTRKIRVVQRA